MIGRTKLSKYAVWQLTIKTSQSALVKNLHLQFEKFDRQQIIAMILTPTS